MIYILILSKAYISALGDLNKSFERLMIECKNPVVKLRIYYLTY